METGLGTEAQQPPQALHPPAPFACLAWPAAAASQNLFLWLPQTAHPWSSFMAWFELLSQHLPIYIPNEDDCFGPSPLSAPYVTGHLRICFPWIRCPTLTQSVVASGDGAGWQWCGTKQVGLASRDPKWTVSYRGIFPDDTQRFALPRRDEQNYITC